ncbi:MAG TPA: hypothetical protein VFE24_01640 [Pirellulales bacterium]|jgi:hypothetical protein|nr:hypothetical protein [Pirellulales bacterium]
MMQRLDPNNTGVVDLDKVEGRSKFFAQRMAEEAGLDTTKPIPVAKLKEAMESRLGGGRGSEARSGESGSSSSSGSADKDKRSGTKSDKEKAKEKDKEIQKERARLAALVPGFGLPDDAALVPGFGEPLALGGTVTTVTSSDGHSSTSSAAADPEEKYRKYAESMMRQYDKNKNGYLEKDEWKEMRGEPEKIANGDGIITLNALTEHLRKANQEAGGLASSEHSSSGGGGWGHHSTSSSSSSKSKKMYPTAADRFPEGTPSWFIRADVDEDGQVSMAEFSATWSDSKVAEFAKYDLNGDGFISASEVLKVERPEKHR